MLVKIAWYDDWRDIRSSGTRYDDVERIGSTMVNVDFVSSIEDEYDRIYKHTNERQIPCKVARTKGFLWWKKEVEIDAYRTVCDTEEIKLCKVFLSSGKTVVTDEEGRLTVCRALKRK